MNAGILFPWMVPLSAGVAAGVALGAVHGWLLWLNVRLYLAGGSWRGAAGLHVIRLGGTAAALWAAVQWGTGVLLAVLAGFLAARSVAVWRRSAAP